MCKGIFSALPGILLKLVTLTFLLMASQVFAFNKLYSHYSSQEEISSVLTDFARQQGYNAQISSLLTGKVSGRFDNIDPNLFIESMKSAFGVHYYIIGRNIYFYNDGEIVQTAVKPAALSANELLKSLRGANLIANELPVRINNSGLLAISGPQNYVDTIVNAIRQFDVANEQQIVMKVFRLHHAKAEDLSITSSDRTVNIPGIASILQSMVSGGITNASSGITVSSHSSVMPGLRGSGLISTAQSNNTNQGLVQSDVNALSGNTNPAFSPSIIADSRLNAVIVHDFDYRIPYYKEVIEELDQPMRLVELHAAIVDIDVGATESLGIDWQAARSTGNWQLGGGVGNTINSSGVINPQGGGIFSTIFSTDRSSFMMQVNMLEEDNKARTLGRPSVLTLDNVEATLEDTTTNYVKVAGNESSDLFEVVSGTILRVTPHIIDDKSGGEPYIQMVISLQTNLDQDDSGTVVRDSSGNVVDTLPPVVKKTTINTQALVQQGQSLLLGGYYTENHTDDNSGVPILKDIPLLGKLFGSESESSSRRERLLLITPRILDINELNVPSDIDNERFIKSPTQSDYSSRMPRAQKESGCASSRSATSTSRLGN